MGWLNKFWYTLMQWKTASVLKNDISLFGKIYKYKYIKIVYSHVLLQCMEKNSGKRSKKYSQGLILGMEEGFRGECVYTYFW